MADEQSKAPSGSDELLMPVHNAKGERFAFVDADSLISLAAPRVVALLERADREKAERAAQRANAWLEAYRQMAARPPLGCPSTEGNFRHRWRDDQCVFCGYIRPAEDQRT